MVAIVKDARIWVEQLFPEFGSAKLHILHLCIFLPHSATMCQKLIEYFCNITIYHYTMWIGVYVGEWAMCKCEWYLHAQQVN